MQLYAPYKMHTSHRAKVGQLPNAANKRKRVRVCVRHDDPAFISKHLSHPCSLIPMGLVGTCLANKQCQHRHTARHLQPDGMRAPSATTTKQPAQHMNMRSGGWVSCNNSQLQANLVPQTLHAGLPAWSMLQDTLVTICWRFINTSSTLAPPPNINKAREQNHRYQAKAYARETSTRQGLVCFTYRQCSSW